MGPGPEAGWPEAPSTAGVVAMAAPWGLVTPAFFGAFNLARDPLAPEDTMTSQVPARPHRGRGVTHLTTLAIAGALLATGCGAATPRPTASVPARSTPMPTPTVSPSPTSTPAPPQPTDLLAGATLSAGDVQAAADSGNALTVDLLQQLELSHPGANFVDSAFSLATALSMLELGARGDTEAQITGVLHSAGVTPAQQAGAWKQLDQNLLDSAKADGISLDNASAIWLQSGLPVNASFLDTLANDFSAPSSQVDLRGDPQSASDLINHWVSDATHGMIPSVVSPSEVQKLLLLLASATYFDANWKYQFIVDNTSAGTFFLSGGSQVSTPMMHGGLWTLRVHTGGGVTAVELPYLGDHYVADILMPTSHPISDFMAGLSANSLASIEQGLTSTPDVQLTMPRFAISSQLPLNSTLSALGMPDAFSNKADFSGIDGGSDLRIGFVKQDVRIKVDEIGTTAAAATVVGGLGGGGPLPPITHVVIDHPFLFVIRDVTSGAIIFTAQVTDPSAAS